MKYIKNMLLSLLLFVSFISAADIPDRPDSWLNDYANVLSGAQKSELNGMLSSLEKRSSNQIFVAIFPQIPEGNYLEDFVVKLFDKWKPGLKGEDNGILLAIFINDRKIRIEVGYGLEDVITDAQSAVVISDYMAPEFKKGDYYKGIKNALSVLIPAAEGKYKIPMERKETVKKKSFSIGDLISLIFIFIIIARIFGGGKSTGYGSKRKGSMAWMILPFILGGGGNSSGSGFGGGSSGGFGGGFGGMSGGGGASGGW